jgi:hypothetical protein
MGVLRPHLALTATDVDRSVPFYEALFGTQPEKRRPGYAKFSVAEPALNFTLTQGERLTCCYARQDKIWVRDPDGTPWEVFVTHEDTVEAGSCGCPASAPGACCGDVEGCCAA